MRMLVGRSAEFQALGADQGRHAHSIVIDELEFALGRDHDIGMLQVAVGDLFPRKLGSHCRPLLRRAHKCRHVAPAALVLDPLKQGFSLDPVHQDDRVAFSVAQRADFLFAVLERHQASQSPGREVLADLLVAAVPMRRLRGKDADRHGVSRGVDSFVDDGKRPGPGPRLAAEHLSRSSKTAGKDREKRSWGSGESSENRRLTARASLQPPGGMKTPA